jgi:hypothetical protein
MPTIQEALWVPDQHGAGVQIETMIAKSTDVNDLVKKV